MDNKQIVEELNKIHNTLSLIETKGQNTILMGYCLNATSQLIKVVSNKLVNSKDEPTEDGD